MLRITYISFTLLSLYYLSSSSLPFVSAISCKGSQFKDCSQYPIITPPLPACGDHENREHVTAAFAVIGDYGYGSIDDSCERKVSDLLTAFAGQFARPHGFDFVLTTGDNNYNTGDCETIQDNIGAFYDTFFTPGVCVSVANTTTPPDVPNPYNNTLKTARFFPSLGNHDWDARKAAGANLPYFRYFNYLAHIPGAGPNGMWYSYKPLKDNSIEIFALNSNLGSTNVAIELELMNNQTAWVRAALKNSTAKFKLVYFHHSAYSTSRHDAIAPWMDLPFDQWGASIVINGHHHVYERIEKNIPYVINGLGGNPYVYDIGSECDTLEQGSEVQYNLNHGALFGLISHTTTPSGTNQTKYDFCFYSYEERDTEIYGRQIDSFSMLLLDVPESDNSKSAQAVVAIGIIFLIIIAIISAYCIRRHMKKRQRNRVQQQTAKDWTPDAPDEPHEDEEAGKRLAVSASEDK